MYEKEIENIKNGNVKILGKMNMFGTVVQFCDCEICKAFLTTERGDMPTKLGRIVQESNDSTDSTVESIVDNS